MTSAGIKTYYRLTKPGIIYGNVMTAAAGLLLAAGRHLNFGLLLATLLGIALVIACGCVLNNYTDRGLDQRMARTKKRALVTGTISGRAALLYGSILGLVGFSVLALCTNQLTVLLGVIGLVDYLLVYGFVKRRSVYGTLAGTIAGATPIAAGYTAVTNQFDGGAVILFLILVCWQMPHFFAIALRRQDDYAAAGVPVLPVVRGIRHTKVQILWYIAAFIAACAALSVYGYAGYSFAIVMAAMGLVWLYKGVRGFRSQDTTAWSKQLFLFSLLILLTLSAMLGLETFLP